MRVLIACGGTGGHINPGLAIADIIKSKYPDAEFLFAGTPKGMESKLVPKAGYKLETIKVAGFQRKISLENIGRNAKALALPRAENVLALRGDRRDDTAAVGDFRHASDLISFIKERYDFNIIAACYPEVHPESTSAVDDLKWLRHKVDCGADHLITQLFLDNKYFCDFHEKACIAGIDIPIEAGIMPVTNKRQIERMVKLCGVQLPKKFVRVLERYEHNAAALRDAGIAYAIDQITDLITEGVDGIHLYTMNDPYVAQKIFSAVESLISVNSCAVM